ncbi:MAG: hypothetical protein N2043_01620 [Ignavibacterium sp.]|nr:hypothetical protein [Ignavibacterium sp.]
MDRIYSEYIYLAEKQLNSCITEEEKSRLRLLEYIIEQVEQEKQNYFFGG